MRLCDLHGLIAIQNFTKNRTPNRATKQDLEGLDGDGAEVGEGGSVLLGHLRCA